MRPLSGPAHLANECLQPLGHVSVERGGMPGFVDKRKASLAQTTLAEDLAGTRPPLHRAWPAERKAGGRFGWWKIWLAENSAGDRLAGRRHDPRLGCWRQARFAHGSAAMGRNPVTPAADDEADQSCRSARQLVWPQPRRLSAGPADRRGPGAALRRFRPDSSRPRLPADKAPRRDTPSPPPS